MILVSAQSANAQTIITGFNFNGATTAARLASTTGQATTITTNFATADLSSFTGTATNAMNGDAPGSDLAFLGGGSSSTSATENGNYAQLALSTVGYNNLSLSYALRGTSTGFTSNQFSYSSDGGANFTNFGSAITPTVGSYAAQTVNFSSVNALNNNANVIIRVTFTGATSNNGNNRIDNLFVTGNVVAADTPEPGTLPLLGMGLATGAGMVGTVRRRGRVRQAKQTA